MTLRITDPSQLGQVSDTVRRQLEQHADAFDQEAAAERLRERAGISTSARGSAAEYPTKARRAHPEEEEGARLIEWIDLFFVIDPVLGRIRVGEYFAHNANGGARSGIEGAIFAGQGVRRGWPDYTLYLPRGRWHGAVLELKAKDGKKPDDEQLDILIRLERAGYKPIVAWGFDEAKRGIEEYIAL